MEKTQIEILNQQQYKQKVYKFFEPDYNNFAGKLRNCLPGAGTKSRVASFAVVRKKWSVVSPCPRLGLLSICSKTSFT